MNPLRIFLALTACALLGCGAAPAPPPVDVAQDIVHAVDAVAPADDASKEVSVFDTAQDEGAPEVNTSDAADSSVAVDVSPTPVFGPIDFDPEAFAPTELSTLNLLMWDGSKIHYNEGIVPYALNTPLFSDYSLKQRAIWIPAGSQIEYHPTGVFTFPVGSVIMKSFLFPADLRAPTQDLRLVETRVLIKSSEGWTAWPYLWESDGSDAKRWVSGSVETVNLIDLEGQAQNFSYLVPQRNQCKDCHDQTAADGSTYLSPIGPKARQLNRSYPYESGEINQIDHLVALGMLTEVPPANERPQAIRFDTLEALPLASMTEEEVRAAARDYLDTNCAHCHSPNAVEGNSSQLWLNHDNADIFHLGVCKLPGSAGKGGVDRKYDIVPGDPDASILIYRTETVDIGSMMPDIGRSLTHKAGVDLLRLWVQNMDYPPCSD